jgi:ATPase subunit of ABC transporter with duplicated ATPase domains
MSDWESIERQKALLEEQEEQAAAVAQEAMARVLRLRKQKKSLVRREAEMSKRGLKFLDELDAAEEAERKKKEEEEKAAVAPSTSSFVGFSGVAMGYDEPLSPSFWAGLDVVDETAEASQGS